MSFTLLTDDGFPLAVRIFEPAVWPRATLIIHGATGTPQRYYRSFARHCQSRGYRVLSFDYRGIGASRPAAMDRYSVTMADWGQRDVAAVHAFAEASYSEDVVVVGHSFGGQALGLFDVSGRVQATVLVASQFGYFRYWPWPLALVLSVFWHAVVPVVVALAGRLPAWVGLGELPPGVALQWARFCRHRDFLLSEYPEARARLVGLSFPLLSFSFPDDVIAPPRAVSALHQHLPGGQLRHRVVEPAELGLRRIGHFGFFRAPGRPLWDELLDFFSNVEAERSTMPHADTGRERSVGSAQVGRPTSSLA